MQSPESLSLPRDTLSRPGLRHNLFKTVMHTQKHKPNSARLFDGFNLLFFCSLRHFVLCFGLSVHRYRGVAAAVKLQSTATHDAESQCEKRTNPLKSQCGIDVAWQDSRPARSDLKGTPTKTLLGIEPSFNRTRGSDWAKKELFHFVNQWFRLHWITAEQTVALTGRSCWAKTEPHWAWIVDKIYVYRIKPLITLF